MTRIDDWPDNKLVARCPSCDSSKTFARATARPRYRCSKCAATFDEPILRSVSVTKFAATYGDNCVEFVAPVSVRELRSLFASGDQQNAIRRLDPILAPRFIEFHIGTQFEIAEDSGKSPEWFRHGGLVDMQVRMRRNQEQFRGKLVARYGDVCAVTGRQPLEVLDAAHLYSYASHPVHRERGGLLLRKDVHRLFDTMLLTIEPERLRSRVAPPLLEEYPSLLVLDGRPLQVPEDRRPDLELLDIHADAAHERWRNLKAELAARG